MNAMKNNRRADNRDMRRLVLAGNLLATLLEQVGANQETPFGRSIGHGLEAWDHAVQDVRKQEGQGVRHD